MGVDHNAMESMKDKKDEVCKLRIQYLGSIRGIVGKSSEGLVLTKDITVGQLINSLSERYGESFRYFILNADEKLRNTVIILLDGVDINQMGGLDTSLKGYSEVKLVIMGLVGGG